MISRFNWFVITLFTIATLTTLTNPPLYNSIAIFLIFSGIIVLLKPSKKRYYNWRIGGVRKMIVLVSLIIICLIIPQVETDPARFSVSSIPQIKS